MRLGTEETPLATQTAPVQEAGIPARKMAPPVQEYLGRVREGLTGVSTTRREELMEHLQARIDLELELSPAAEGNDWAIKEILARIGEPVEMARQLRGTLPAEKAVQRSAGSPTGGKLGACRTCGEQVSREAFTCPHCGAPWPARQHCGGIGYEWKSKQTLFGLPLVHVAVGRNEQGKLRVAKGIVAIGQFGIGVITIAQFGVGAIFGLGQFVVAPLALGQFALGIVAAGQFGIGLLAGAGMFSTGLFSISPFKK